MKKFLIFAVLLLASAGIANAQLMRVQQNLWRSGTTLSVMNETGSAVLVYIDGRPMGAVSPQQTWSDRFGGGVWPLYSNEYSRSLTLEVRICERLSPVAFAVAPPEWATDRELLGPLAIIASDAKLSEPALRAKARQIERFLEKRRPLGWREMRRGIRDWIRNAVLAGSGTRCIGPLIFGGEVEIRTSNYAWYGERRTAMVFYVRERGGNYVVDHAGSGNPSSW